MEAWINQFVAKEQKTVLRTLAETAAKKGCLFLEVGSWCGDSALILGKVAQEAGGKLLCVDWWKGSDASYLSWVAKNYDVYSIFWNRIKEAGLEDAVIPIRSNSEVAALFLKERTFDLVYLDSDHRFEPTSGDLIRFAPLVKEGGLFCGHDCEGILSDFDPDFLRAGKEKDVHESVHCGTVLAVGGFFRDYSIHHSIWSVRATGKKNPWEPVKLSFPDIANERQAAVPAIGFIGQDKVYRYGKAVYSIPENLPEADIRDESTQSHPEVVSAENLEGLVQKKKESFRRLPVLICLYKEFNLISRNSDEVIGVCQALGPVDLSRVSDEQQEIWRQQGYLFRARSFEDVVRQISQAYPQLNLPARLVEVGYRGFNIFSWKDKFCAMDQSVGSVDLSKETEASLQKYMADGKCVIGEGSVQEVKRLVDQVVYDSFQKELARRDVRLVKEMTMRDKHIAVLQEELLRIKTKWWYKIFTWKSGKSPQDQSSSHEPR